MTKMASLKNYTQTYEEPQLVIHRSANQVIVRSNNTQSRPIQNWSSTPNQSGNQTIAGSGQQLDVELRGFRCPPEQHYKPIGAFQNVVPVIEEIKLQLEHSNDLSPDTQKYINKIKRVPELSFYNSDDDPLRTWKSIRKGVVSLKKGLTDDEMNRKQKNRYRADGKKLTGFNLTHQHKHVQLHDVMEAEQKHLKACLRSLEQQFKDLPTPSQLDRKKRLRNESESSSEEEEILGTPSNQRLLTPTLIKLRQKKDASSFLKEEVLKSSIRMKAAKYGGNIDAISPNHEERFYLPSKEKFKLPNFDRNQQKTATKDFSKSVNLKSTLDQQQKPDYSDNTFLTETMSLQKRQVNTSMQTPQSHKLKDMHQQLSQSRQKRGFKTHLEMAKEQIKKLGPEQPTSLNEVSRKFNSLSVAPKELKLSQAAQRELQVKSIKNELQEQQKSVTRQVLPSYLRLLSLQQYRMLLTKEKQEEHVGQSIKVKKQIPIATNAQSLADYYIGEENPQITSKDEQLALSKEQDKLLNLIIHFDALKLESPHDAVKKKLYELFFQWKSDEADCSDQDQPQKMTTQLREDQIRRRKRASLRKEAQIQEFKDNGGFTGVLAQIFNPTNQRSLELDSVVQIKKHAIEYYERKTKMTKQLIDALDALNNERPCILRSKRKYFCQDRFADSRLQMEWTRTNAEKERIGRFKQIALDQSKSYYRVLGQLNLVIDPLVDDATQHLKPIDNSFQAVSQKMQQREQLIKVLSYSAEYIKQLIENGTEFKVEHLFILIMQLEPSYFTTDLKKCLTIIIEEFGFSKVKFQQFVQTLKDEELRAVLKK